MHKPLIFPSRKRGSTFRVDIAYAPADGWPADLSGMEVRSSLSHNGTPVATLTVTKTSDNLGLRLRAPEGTKNWPVGQLDGDLLFTLPDGSFEHTATFIAPIERPVTEAPQ
jgi:hypothetical protein